MIAVIADDFTGAAEIGGVGLKYGLKVIIETEVNHTKNADLLIIATDTRSLPAGEAYVKTKEIVTKLLKLEPEYIFKKLDSVLRGNIAGELVAHMEASGKKRAVIVAANPAMGRIIDLGRYFVYSVPLSETSFAHDPEFPIQSSTVTEIIQSRACPVVSLSVDDELPEYGLIVGNATGQNDLTRWAERIDDSVVAAGGSGFFDILLGLKYSTVKTSKEPIPVGDRTLFVFGSTFPKNNETAKRLSCDEIVKLNMPEAIYFSNDFDPELIDQWRNEIVGYLNRKQKVIISVEHSYSNEPGLSSRIKETVAKLISQINQETELTDLYIEGGATTSEILKSLKISKLYPCTELDFGIIQMKVDEYPNLCITTKPGSYLWPESIIFENY